MLILKPKGLLINPQISIRKIPLISVGTGLNHKPLESSILGPTKLLVYL